jgi:hypothetical protein
MARAGEATAEWARDIIWTASADAPRSQQASIGPSELGLACTRQLAFRLTGTAPTNMTIDPLASIAGTAMHAWMAQTFRALRPPGRFLVEHSITYSGVGGTLDLYDRHRQMVVDWKFPKLAKSKRMRAEGPPVHYRWQIQTYAAGLAVQGEQPLHNAIVVVPIDGKLEDIFAWAFPVDRAEADEAIDRLKTSRQQLEEVDGQPGKVAKQPSRLCPWCPYFRISWNGNPDLACCGEEKTA